MPYKLSDLFGRYSLPSVMGRLGHRIGGLFHHDMPGGTGASYGGNPFAGPGDFTNGYTIGSGGQFDIGNGFLGGQHYDPFNPGADAYGGNTPHQGGNQFPVAPTGGGGPSQTTNGFSTAFRGGGEVYDPAELIQALKLKGGNAIR